MAGIVSSCVAGLRFVFAPFAWWDRRPPQPRFGGDPEPVRAAMRALAREATGQKALRLALAIEVAQDLQALWFLRSSLMQALAAERGERHARTVLAGVDEQFRALWPDAPVSRPAPLFG
jgi:hypothetical protein